MGYRVVVVDDQADVRLLLRMHLELDGHAVVAECADGVQALQEVARVTPDVVVLDQQLPDARGTDLVAGLRAASPGARVVVFSGDPAGRQSAEQAGADGFVVKGTSLGDLSRLLESLLEGDRP